MRRLECEPERAGDAGNAPGAVPPLAYWRRGQS